jgi:hypothetical protein
MKYKIVNFEAPHVVVEYSTDDGLKKSYLNVRIDKKLDGTLPQGTELDNYILSYAPDLSPKEDPYAGVDWSHIQAKVESPSLTPDEVLLKEKGEAQMYLATTDWYITRHAETGKEVPADVLEKRAAARLTLSN